MSYTWQTKRKETKGFNQVKQKAKGKYKYGETDSRSPDMRNWEAHPGKGDALPETQNDNETKEDAVNSIPVPTNCPVYPGRYTNMCFVFT